MEVIGFEDGFPMYSTAWVNENQDQFQLVVGGRPLKAPATAEPADLRMVDLMSCQKSVKVQIYRTPNNCREYLPEPSASLLEIPFPQTYDPDNVCSRDQDSALDNGITVGNPRSSTRSPCASNC